LTQTGRHSRRIRRLPAAAVVWLVIAIGIWTDLDIPAIWRQCGLTVGVQQTERRGYNLAPKGPNPRRRLRTGATPGTAPSAGSKPSADNA